MINFLKYKFKSLWLFLLVLISSISATSQSSELYKADQLVKELNYVKAIKKYQKVLKKHNDSAMVAEGLGEIYYELRNVEEGLPWWSILIHNEPEDSDYLKYAELLKSSGNYELAQQYMILYGFLDESDSRAAAHMYEPNYKGKLEDKATRFELRHEKENSDFADFSPVYYGKQIVFCSNRLIEGITYKKQHAINGEPFLNLLVADVDKEGNLFNVAPFSHDLNTKFHEGPVSFSKDLNQVYFTRNNFLGSKRNSSSGINKLKIFIAARKGSGWSTPHEFQHNSDEYSTGHPALSADGNTLYFVSDRPGGFGGTDLWKCVQENNTWGAPENLGSNYNTEGNEMFPFVHADGTLYYSSDGLLGLGGLDVFECSVINEKLGKPKNLKNIINSSADDFGFAVNHEKNQGYFSSNRKSEKNGDNIFHFTMKEETPLTISGLVLDGENEMIPFEGAKVELLNSSGQPIQSDFTGKDGYFMFNLDPEECGYKLIIYSGEDYASYENDQINCDQKEGNIQLNKIPVYYSNWQATGTVIDKQDFQPIEGFKVTLQDVSNQTETNQVTGKNGAVSIELQPNTNYALYFEKEGWFKKSAFFTTNNMKSENLLLESIIDLEFEKIELGKAIKIENIYYDYNQATIRPDAAKELNKIVLLLEDNPSLKIELGSHTDSRGTDSYNLELSENRAKAAAKYLEDQGISKNRLTYKGYGETVLLNSCENETQCTEQEHEENRRTEFKVIGFLN